MLKKVDLFGLKYSVTDYDTAVDQIMVYVDLLNRLGESRVGYGVTALAVHGLIEGYRDAVLKNQINSIDLVLPDGQPVRWAIPN